jgi:hypothetical protein
MGAARQASPVSVFALQVLRLAIDYFRLLPDYFN